VADLCGMAAEQPERLRELAADGRLTVIACRPRAVRWLLRYAGLGDSAEEAEVLDMRSQPAEEIIARLPGAAPAPPLAADPPKLAASGGWVPWFPVIDYDRCVNCLQCLSFCPFGVYGTDAGGRVAVAHPASCKNGCPACSRICPELAIIFPKHGEAPVDGAEVSDADIRARQAATLEKRLAGRDIHDVLAARRAKLQSRLAAETSGCGCTCNCASDADRGEAERERCVRQAGQDEPCEDCCGGDCCGPGAGD